jgi:hypothetical protein
MYSKPLNGLQSKNLRYCPSFLSFVYRTVGPMEQEDFMDDLAAVIANTIRKENRHPQQFQDNHIHLLFLLKIAASPEDINLKLVSMDYMVIL